MLDIKATLRSTLIESLLPNKRERLPVVSSEVKYNQLHKSQYSRGRLTSSKGKNSSSVETSLEKEERREKKKEDLLRATGVSSVLCVPPASFTKARQEGRAFSSERGGGGGEAQRWRLLKPGTFTSPLPQLRLTLLFPSHARMSPSFGFRTSL